jgi:ferredoxin-type protein NapH
MISKNSLTGALSLAFVLAVAIGGFFYPYVGFAVAVVMVLAMVMSLFKPRLFCAKACPRGRALGFGLKKLSRGKPLSPTALSAGSRRALCGFMMLCVGGNIYRLFGSAAALGSFFWGLCVVSLGAGVVVGLIYKPRAWCVVCPMGTLQETIGARTR